MQWKKATPGSVNPNLPDDTEIVANLWYIIDHQGFIYSLRVMCYAATGTDQEKLAFLASRAYLDFLVARPFPVPERYGTTFVGDGGERTKYAVIHHDSTAAIGGVDQLFFDALDTMQSDLPAQTKLQIPESPLIKVTALHGGQDGVITPVDALSGSAV
ncbi:hypothetical protein [Thermomonas mangrovi]|uniref:hypothetical protein n=1 Tax=Thermomonas mangrovi TaxID=2993316 RepID=UPI002307FB55|nr:hypothetical protein [Thermomonas mangrovi]